MPRQHLTSVKCTRARTRIEARAPRHTALLALSAAALVVGCDPAARRGTDSTGAAPRRDGVLSSDAAPSPSGPIRITGDSVGPVAVGSTVDEAARVARVIRDTTERGSEGMMERTLILGVAGDSVRAVLDDAGRMFRFHVRSPRFRTADSLAPGVALSRLLSREGVRGITGEGRLYVQLPSHCGMSFRPSGSGGLAARAGPISREALARLPAETYISEILVFGCRADDAPG